jgi:hypothetical protein
MNARMAAAIAVVWFVSVTGAFAGPRDDALEAVAKCAVIADDHARLACYDSSAPKVKDALGAPAETPGAATVEQQKSWFGLPTIFGGGGNGRPAQTTPKEFGNERLAPPPPPAPVPGQPAPPPPPQVIDSITAVVSDYAFNPFGRVVIFLDNGQIWQQLQGDTDVAHFRKRGPNSVTISRGLLGSYNLQVNDSAVMIKVKRLK